MRLWQKLQYLRPSYRRAQEQDMQAELESLAAMAGPRELGNMTRVAEEGRAAWGWVCLEQFCRDLQYALRTLRHNPGFTATAVLSLGLGIGANTAVFSLIDAITLRWLPVRAPQELVQLSFQPNRGENRGEDAFSYAAVKALADRKDLFAGVFGVSGTTFNVGSPGSVSRVDGAWVTGDYYVTLGVTAALGRLLGREDDREGAPLAAVIGYGYWKSRYAGNPDAIGQALVVNGTRVHVVGVSSPGFTGVNVGSLADITMAVAAVPQISPSFAGALQPGSFWLRTLARPQPGVSVSRTTAHLNAVWPQIADAVVNPEWQAWQRKELADSRFDLRPGGTGISYLRERFGRPLLVLLAVAGLMLLIACANVASLLLARATARRREISVRLAIGAGRGRIIRQLLTESAMLSVVGAGVGVCLAWIGSRFLLATLSGNGDLPVTVDLTPNWHILGFASAIALANGLLFGLAPAFQTTALGGSAVLKEDTRVTRSHSRLLSSLVIVQVALSLLLLVGAGLFLRTLQNLLNVDPGFRREGVLAIDLDGQREGYRDQRLTAFYGDLLDRVRSVPGVAAASICSHTPLSGWTWTEAVAPKGQPVPERDNAVFMGAGPDYFTTLQTRILAGREFAPSDRGAANVAIVNQAFAERFFAGRSPLGEYLTATITKPPSELAIVGVVHDSIQDTLRGAPRPMVYVAYFQRASSADSLVIRATGSLSQVASAIRKELQPSFPSTPVEVRPLTAQVEQTLLEERLMAKLAGGFGALGLLLACVGLYGLLAYSVSRRTKEIGVRMALGAQRGAVLWMVAGRALALVAVGVAIGVPVSWTLSQKVQSMLFGLTATDPGVIGTAVVLLSAAGLAAAYFPARRASRVDPMTALRHE
ncbi:MAG: ABC transporter permease [Ignavibacteriota bacterium]